METLIEVFFRTDRSGPIQRAGSYASEHIDAECVSYTSYTGRDLRVTVEGEYSLEQSKDFITWVRKRSDVQSVDVWSRVQA